MKDQATTRRLVSAAPNLAPRSFKSMRPVRKRMFDYGAQTRTIAITSGKGGVGKSNISVNVSLELAALGRRVTLLDADLALANADVLLGLNPRYHLGHVLAGQRSLEEVIIKTGGIRLLPGGSGIEELANLTLEQHTRFIAELRAMETESDFMIIDTAAGIAGNVTGILRAASEVVIVTTPDPTAVVDAYAMIKVLHQHSPSKLIRIIVNDVVGSNDAQHIFEQIRRAAEQFLTHEIELLGTIPHDAELAKAVRQQRPVTQFAPNAPASRAIRLIAEELHTEQLSVTAAAEANDSFWTSVNESTGGLSV